MLFFTDECNRNNLTYYICMQPQIHRSVLYVVDQSIVGIHKELLFNKIFIYTFYRNV